MSITRLRDLRRFSGLLATLMTMAALGGAGALPAVASAQMPPPGPPVPQPAFHFSDPGLDREYQRLNAHIADAGEPFGRALASARAAVWAARNVRPGSATWARARDAVGEAIRRRRPLRESMSAYIAFLTDAARRAPDDEARVAIGDRYLAQNDLAATGDRLLELLADLARLEPGD